MGRTGGMGNLSQKDYVEYKMCKENRLRDLEKQEKNFREQEVSLERDGETYLKAVRALIKLKNEQVLTRELIESLIDKMCIRGKGWKSYLHTVMHWWKGR